jgi:hypothetical protein
MADTNGASPVRLLSHKPLEPAGVCLRPAGSSLVLTVDIAGAAADHI